MKTVPFGPTGTHVPNVISGMIRIADKTDQQIRDLYVTAREAGVSRLGPPSHPGRVVRPYPGGRAQRALIGSPAVASARLEGIIVRNVEADE